MAQPRKISPLCKWPITGPECNYCVASLSGSWNVRWGLNITVVVCHNRMKYCWHRGELFWPRVLSSWWFFSGCMHVWQAIGISCSAGSLTFMYLDASFPNWHLLSLFPCSTWHWWGPVAQWKRSDHFTLLLLHCIQRPVRLKRDPFSPPHFVTISSLSWSQKCFKTVSPTLFPET